MGVVYSQASEREKRVGGRGTGANVLPSSFSSVFFFLWAVSLLILFLFWGGWRERDA